MNLELSQDGLCLKPKQLLKVHAGAGHAIVCHTGSLWVTQQRDWRDVVLEAGQSFTLDRDGLTLVQALAQSTVSVAPPGTRPWFAAVQAAVLPSPAAIGI